MKFHAKKQIVTLSISSLMKSEKSQSRVGQRRVRVESKKSQSRVREESGKSQSRVRVESEQSRVESE